MAAGINTNYNNYYSGITQAQQTQKTSKAGNDKKTQTLDDFKREMYDTINKMQVHPSQFKTQISINISDKAFEKMMNDPEYKNLMLKTIQRDLNGAYPGGGVAPSYSVITIGNDCEYRADAYGSAYGGTFVKASSNSFWEKNTKRASSDYDEYNRRRNQNNSDYRDIADKRLAESRFQNELLLAKDFEKKLQDKKLEQTERQKKALDAYGSNIMTMID